MNTGQTSLQKNNSEYKGIGETVVRVVEKILADKKKAKAEAEAKAKSKKNNEEE